jgi:hypothetical protein
MAKAVIAKSADGPIYAASITLKNGRVIHAADYNKKAFVFYPRKRKR